MLTASERAWVSTRRTYADLTAPPLGPAIGYDYDDTDHIHAVTSLETGELYEYDANGNMKSRIEGGSTYTQTFDIHNRLATVTVGGQTTQFIYDGDGNLVKKINPNGSKTIYVGGIYEVDKNSSGTVTGTKTYYPAAGAMRIGSTLYYVLGDHLGSASVVTNNAGAIVGEDRFYSFGETRFTTGTMFTDKLYTGQRELAGLGIYHYGARFYSPKLGRFLSADTIVPGYANPQNLNRFSYTLNNPLKYTDPTGHMVASDLQGTGGGGQCDQRCLRRLQRERQRENEEDASPPATSTPPVLTPTPTSTPTITPSLTLTPCPQVAQACVPTSTPTPSPTSTAEFTIRNVTATSTPTATPISHSDFEFPVNSVVPSIFSWPPDFAPNADDIWNIIGNTVPLLFNQPVINSNTIANSIADGVTNAINTASNTLWGYAGYLVSPGISPIIPIVPYAPSTNPFAPVYQ